MVEGTDPAAPRLPAGSRGRGAAEYNAASPRCCTTGREPHAFPRATRRRVETGQNERGPGDRWGHCLARTALAARLFQRSLLGLPDPRTPRTAPSERAPRHRHRKTHDRHHGAGVRSSTPEIAGRVKGQTRSWRRRDQHRRASMLLSAARVFFGARLRARRGAPLFGGALGGQALEVVGGVVDVAHRRRHGPVARLIGDEAVHLLAHPAVRRMTLR
jgi:hypothetical protein